MALGSGRPAADAGFAGRGLVYADHVLAGGGPHDFTLAHHVQLAGAQREIGFDLADLAWTHHTVKPAPSANRSLTRARRRWRAVHWPELDDRAQGVADR